MSKRMAGIAFNVAFMGAVLGLGEMAEYRKVHNPVFVELREKVRGAGQNCVIDHAFLQEWKPGRGQTISKGDNGMCVAGLSFNLSAQSPLNISTLPMSRRRPRHYFPKYLTSGGMLAMKNKF